MIETGTGKIGMKVTSLDGEGVIEKVYDQDNVLVRLTDGSLCKCDLEKCTEIK